MNRKIAIIAAAAMVSAGQLIVFHTDEGFHRIRQFNSKKADAAEKIDQMTGSALSKEAADRPVSTRLRKSFGSRNRCVRR